MRYPRPDLEARPESTPAPRRTGPTWSQFLRFQADTVLAGAGIQTVLCNIRTPRMNAIAERWIGGRRRELPDRTPIWNQAHLRRILRQYEAHHNQHRPHRSLHGVAPLKPLPEPADLEQYRVRKQGRVGALINEIAWSHDVDAVFGTHNTGSSRAGAAITARPAHSGAWRAI